MLRTTKPRLPMRLALASLGFMALLAGCAVAPVVTALGPSAGSPSKPLSVQGVLKAELERAGIEPSPYHEVALGAYLEPFVVVPVAERDGIFENPDDIYGLIPDPANPDRFTRVQSPEASGVTHLGYYPEWSNHFGTVLAAERGGVAATRMGLSGDETPRVAFPRAASGPIQLRGKTANMALITWEDEKPVVYRKLTVAENLISPLDGARDAVVVFTVKNLAGEPINGLTKDHIRFSLIHPQPHDDESVYPLEKLEAIAEGTYRIQEPFLERQASGSIRFKVEVVSAGTPIRATFYRQ